jgi:hypothetical protein
MSWPVAGQRASSQGEVGSRDEMRLPLMSARMGVLRPMTTGPAQPLQSSFVLKTKEPDSYCSSPTMTGQ